MKIPRYDRPTTIFFAITLVSVGLLAYPMWNYTKYYMALWSFDYTVSNVTLSLNQANMYVVNVKLLFNNPTDYSGLELHSISIGLQYVNPSQTRRVWDPSIPGHWGGGWAETNVWILKTQDFYVNLPVVGYANEILDLDFVVNPAVGTDLDKENAFAFTGFMNAHPGEVEWGLNSYLSLSSFLGGYTVYRYLSYVTPLTYQ